MNKRICLTLSVLCILLFGCYERPITEQDQYAFLQWYIDTNNPKDLSNELINIETIMVNLEDVYNASTDDCRFSNKDKAFIKAQISKNSKIKLLIKTKLQHTDWIKSNSGTVTYLSIPVFNKDGSVAIINRWHYCGNLCGDGGIEVYKKTFGTWIKVKLRIPHIVS